MNDTTDTNIACVVPIMQGSIHINISQDPRCAIFQHNKCGCLTFGVPGYEMGASMQWCHRAKPLTCWTVILIFYNLIWFLTYTLLGYLAKYDPLWERGQILPIPANSQRSGRSEAAIVALNEYFLRKLKILKRSSLAKTRSKGKVIIFLPFWLPRWD